MSPAPAASIGAYEPQEVEFFGAIYTTKELSRGARLKLALLEREIRDEDVAAAKAADDIDDEAEAVKVAAEVAGKVADDNAQIIGKILDLVLSPVGENGKRISTAIGEKRKKDELGDARLLVFFQQVLSIDARPR